MISSDDELTAWTEDNEATMRLWVRQMVSLSYLYVKAARWSRHVDFVCHFIGVFGTLYTFPGYGCGLVTKAVCTDLQLSGIILSIFVGITNVLSAIFSVGSRTPQYERASRDILKISRHVDTELSKPLARREDAIAFRERIIGEFEEIVDKIRLPSFIGGERQLANISLLQSWTPAAEHSRSRSMVLVTDTDRQVMDEIRANLERLDIRASLSE